MGPEIVNRNKDSIFHGDFVGRDQNVTNIILFKDNEREFVVTHNANIKPVSYFTGRETELRELRQRIEDGRKSVLVSGMGGIGKTHICRKLFGEYLNKHAEGGNELFCHIGYIEYDGDMGSSLQKCLKFKQQDSPEQNLEAAWKELGYLASDGKLLLFVDNVDKPMRADPGLQQLNSIPGAVVLTSRQAVFSDEFEPYQIGFLGMEQCKEIYEKIRFRGSSRKVGLEEVEDLEYVIESLAGRHTITLELLAHLAQIKTWPVRKLREKLEEKGFYLKFHKGGELINIQKSYEALYDLSQLSQAEQNILEAFSVFPYIPVEAEMCNEWLLSDAGVSEDDDILMGLYQKGWLQFDIEQESYSMHPVFAQFIYEKCRPKMENHIKLIKACQKSMKIPETGSILKCQWCISFAQCILEKLPMDDSMEKAELISSIAFLLQYICHYEEAENLFEKSIKIREKLLGKEHLKLLIEYDNLADMYYYQGDYIKAGKLYKKVLKIRQNSLGENHPDTAKSYYNLACNNMLQKRYKKAERLFRYSLKIDKPLLGENHEDIALIYSNLGELYNLIKEYKKAENLFKKALLIKIELIKTEDNPDIATMYSNLSWVYKSQNNYKMASYYALKSHEIYLSTLGPWHRNTLLARQYLVYLMSCIKGI